MSSEQSSDFADILEGASANIRDDEIDRLSPVSDKPEIVSVLAQLPDFVPGDSPKSQGAFIKSLLADRADIIQMMMPTGDDTAADRIIASATKAIVADPKILECTPASIISAVLDSARLGVDCSGTMSMGYIIPYGTTATFQVGYKGLLDIAYRGGKLVSSWWGVVCKGDHFVVKKGTSPEIEHHPDYTARRDDQDVVAVYCCAELINSNHVVFEVLNRDAIMRVQAMSKQRSKSVWKTNWQAMALKSACIRMAKLLPSSPALVRAAELHFYAEGLSRQRNQPARGSVSPVEELRNAARASRSEVESTEDQRDA